MDTEKKRAKNNRTLTLNSEEIDGLRSRLLTKENIHSASEITNRTINGDLLEMLEFVPDGFADLIIIDPPYNLSKNFNGMKFSRRSQESYDEYLETWFPKVCKKLKANGSLYMCGDWKCTASLQNAIEKQLTVLNRITWQREKGRGAKNNWKNGMEDIWFAVKNPDDYYFNVDAVMCKRQVLAPYKADGKPKDWDDSLDGKFRLTYPSNFWDDISIPFWSMPDTGSSKSRRLGSSIIAMDNSTLCSCPPERLHTCWSMKSFASNTSKAFSISLYRDFFFHRNAGTLD